MGIRIVRDLGECERIWKSYYPVEGLFDLWEVRSCFASAFRREPYFIIYEEESVVYGLIPLCLISETGTYAFFPGETWNHKTWMEQNKIVACDENCLNAMLEAIPGESHIRYLNTVSGYPMDPGFYVDEIGYLFYPKVYGYSYENYLGSIPGKTRKKILGETSKIKARGVTYRINETDDISWVFTLNLESFGEASYFHDPRFFEGFNNLIDWLKDQDMLRVVTLLVDGVIAAVDIGAVYNKQCVLLAGGTNRDYPGVAKVINLYHLEWACRERMEKLDFLCGDFGWKERFRLSQRPLYVLSDMSRVMAIPASLEERIPAYAS